MILPYRVKQLILLFCHWPFFFHGSGTCRCCQSGAWTFRGTVTVSDRSRFYLQQLGLRANVSRRHGEHYADCCTDRVTLFGGGGVMVWGGTSTPSHPVEIQGLSSLEVIPVQGDMEMRFCNQWQAIPHLHSPGPDSILQDVHAGRAKFIRDKEVMPGCCGCVWFFRTLLRLLFAKCLHC